MHAGRGEPYHHVAALDVGAREQRVALGGTHREAGEVIVAVVIEARHLGGLAAYERTAGLAAARRHALDHLRTDLGSELSTGKIVEKKKRLRPLHHDVVD